MTDIQRIDEARQIGTWKARSVFFGDTERVDFYTAEVIKLANQSQNPGKIREASYRGYCECQSKLQIEQKEEG